MNDSATAQYTLPDGSAPEIPVEGKTVLTIGDIKTKPLECFGLIKERMKAVQSRVHLYLDKVPCEDLVNKKMDDIPEERREVARSISAAKSLLYACNSFLDRDDFRTFPMNSKDVKPGRASRTEDYRDDDINDFF